MSVIKKRWKLILGVGLTASALAPTPIAATLAAIGIWLLIEEIKKEKTQ